MPDGRSRGTAWTPLLTVCCAGMAMAQSSPITVVDAASYRATIAPDSLAAIFGTGLSRTNASATLDASGSCLSNSAGPASR